jgi:hypothetical protein
MEVAVIIVSVSEMLSVFRMKQVFSVKAGFVATFVEGKNLICNRYLSNAVFCFTADYLKVSPLIEELQMV